jgi:hypothetical protein
MALRHGAHMSDDDDPPSDFPGKESGDTERKRLFERVLPEMIQRVVERAVETGVEKLAEAPENLRELVRDLKLPKEAADHIYDQIDDTKKGVYKVVAREIRDVIEHINFADEIADVLTKLSFEINTTIRFVPNRAEDSDGEGEEAENDKTDEESGKRPSRFPRPKVMSKVVMKAREVVRGASERPPPEE